MTMNRDYIAWLNRRFLILLGFALPISVSTGSIVAPVVMALWVLEGGFKEKWEKIRTNKIALAFVACFCLNVIGLLWTDDIGLGLKNTAKHWTFLLAPMIMTMAEDEDMDRYFIAFLAAMTVMVIASYLLWLNVFHLPRGYWLNPILFIGRITYNVVLAFAIYLLGHYLIFRDLSRRRKILCSILAVVMVADMFIATGRVGQFGFCGIVMLLSFQYFRKGFLKPFLVAVLGLSLTIGFSLRYNANFQRRVNAFIVEYHRLGTNPKDSLTSRVYFAANSLVMIAEHPLLGVGTGDFPKEYARINAARTPDLRATDDPHNHYLLVLTQFGVVGLIVYLYLFYLLIRYALLKKDKFQQIRMALPVLYLIVMMGATYLRIHITSLMFCYFCGILYREGHVLSSPPEPSDERSPDTV